MAIVYCCWTTGDDTTGDGSYGTPYKTITKASTGLTGGDEVRVSKSPAHTALTGTLTWTIDSKTVSTSVDLTGELTAGDMVGKDADDNMWYEVASLNSTTITLRAFYCGTSEAVAGYKMGFHDYGSPTLTAQVQVISASGTSKSSRLKISGGWDLSTQTQTAWSFFICTHASSRYGYGIYGTNKSYIELEKLVFSRVYQGFVHAGSGVGWLIKNCGADECRSTSFSLSTLSDVEFDGLLTATSYAGTLFSHGSDCTLNNIVLGASPVGFAGVYTPKKNTYIKKISVLCVGYGISFKSKEVWVDELEARYCGRGLMLGTSAFGGGEKHKIGKATIRNCTYGYQIQALGLLTIGTLVESDNTNILEVHANVAGTELPVLGVQRWNDTAGDSRLMYAYGTVFRDTTDSRSGACLKATPSDATYYMQIALGKHRVTSVAADIVLSVYAKDDATFNGDVALMALMNGQVVSDFWVEKTMDTTYGQHTLTVDTLDLVNGEWLELVARVRGTAGSVFFDDFAAAAA